MSQLNTFGYDPYLASQHTLRIELGDKLPPDRLESLSLARGDVMQRLFADRLGYSAVPIQVDYEGVAALATATTPDAFYYAARTWDGRYLKAGKIPLGFQKEAQAALSEIGSLVEAALLEME